MRAGSDVATRTVSFAPWRFVLTAVNRRAGALVAVAT
jgi:hypothetical protein